MPHLREEIFREFKGLGTETCPFANLPEKKGARAERRDHKRENEGVSVAKAKAGLRVAFVEWTDTGNLRHAKFVAMRDDKKAREVVRET